MAEKGRGARTPPAVWALAAAHVLLHLVANARDHMFRDEFYYLACADHLDWGYVDHPPLSIALLWLQRALLGDSVLASRVLPALAGAALVWLGARLAREMGGAPFAQTLAALSVAVAGQYLGITGFFSMNAFDLLLWALGALVVTRLITTDDPRLWLWLGLIMGAGLLNKISVLFFAFGLAVAVALTPRLRRHLATPYPWAGGLLAAALFAPHILWQVRHDWATLEFVRNAQQYKIARFTPLEFFLAQVLELNPFNALLWLGGLGWLLAGREGRRFRPLGIIYVVAFVVMVLQKSKPYYLGPSYTMLLAAGAVATDAFLSRRHWAWPRPLIATVLLASGVLIAPFAVSILHVDTFIAYQRALGLAPRSDENQRLGPLPQFFADRQGWPEMAAAVADVYRALPEPERRGVLIVTSNYGEAGALRYYGRALGLPPAVSQHNNFYLWGPGVWDGRVAITVGMAPEDVADEFESVTVAGRLDSPYAMPYETRQPILVCRGLKRPLPEAWRDGKKYI